MSNKPIQGIDISRFQAHMDWQRIGETMPDLRFVYIKATQGLGYIDPLMEEHRAGALSIQKPFGLFHFLDYFNYQKGGEVEFGIAQAEFHHKVIKPNPGQLPVAIDIETNEGVRWGRIDLASINRVWKIKLAYCKRMAELTGNLIQYELGWTTAFDRNFLKWELWLPRYKAVKDSSGHLYQPSIRDFLTEEELAVYPKPVVHLYKGYRLWQCSSAGRGYFFGMRTNEATVDLDVFMDGKGGYGTEEQFSLWCGQHCIPTMPEVPEDQPIELTPATGKKGIVSSGDKHLIVRIAPGTGSAMALRPDGSYMQLNNGAVVDILEYGTDSAKNPWIRIGYGQWVCVNYFGLKLVEIK